MTTNRRRRAHRRRAIQSTRDARKRTRRRGFAFAKANERLIEVMRKRRAIDEAPR